MLLFRLNFLIVLTPHGALCGPPWPPHGRPLWDPPVKLLGPLLSVSWPLRPQMCHLGAPLILWTVLGLPWASFWLQIASTSIPFGPHSGWSWKAAWPHSLLYQHPNPQSDFAGPSWVSVHFCRKTSFL